MWGANYDIIVRGTRVEPHHDKTCSSVFQNIQEAHVSLVMAREPLMTSSPLTGNRRVCKHGHATTASRKCSWITLSGFFSQWSAFNTHKLLADKHHTGNSILHRVLPGMRAIDGADLCTHFLPS